MNRPATIPDQRFALKFYLVTATFIPVIWYCIGFYAEQPDDMLSVMFSGRLMGEPFTDIFYIAYNLLREGFALAYKNFPKVAWFDWFNYTVLWYISTGLILELLKLLRFENANFRLLLLFALVSWGALFSDFFILFSHTKLAFLVALYGYFLFRQTENKHAFISGIAWFVLGFMIRPEAALGLIAVAFPFTLIINTNFTETFRIWRVVLLFSGVSSCFFLLQMRLDESFTRQVEPDLEYQIQARRNIIPISEMKNSADSVCYQMAEQWIINDPEHISIAFLRGIVADGNTPEFHPIKHLKSLIVNMIDNVFYTIIWVFLLLLSILSIIANDVELRNTGKSLFLYWCYSLFLIIMLTYLIKMEGRVYSSLVFISSILIMSLKLERLALSEAKRFILQIALSGMFIVILLGNILQHDFRRQAEIRYDENESFIAYLNEHMRKERLLLDRSIFSKIYTPPFSSKRLDPEIEHVVHNLGTLILTNQYQHFLMDKCNCNPTNYNEFYTYISDNQYLILSDIGAIDLTAKYLKFVYHQEFLFMEERSLSGGVSVYRVQKNE